ncbi:MAG: hypothetical protein M1819_001104 [Sarea resinae]|nr:MAG: hypothetical protein M1819_001104 [Sarea resinae]
MSNGSTQSAKWGTVISNDRVDSSLKPPAPGTPRGSTGDDVSGLAIADPAKHHLAVPARQTAALKDIGNPEGLDR